MELLKHHEKHCAFIVKFSRNFSCIVWLNVLLLHKLMMLEQFRVALFSFQHFHITRRRGRTRHWGQSWARRQQADRAGESFWMSRHKLSWDRQKHFRNESLTDWIGLDLLRWFILGWDNPWRSGHVTHCPPSPPPPSPRVTPGLETPRFEAPLATALRDLAGVPGCLYLLTLALVHLSCVTHTLSDLGLVGSWPSNFGSDTAVHHEGKCFGCTIASLRE